MNWVKLHKRDSVLLDWCTENTPEKTLSLQGCEIARCLPSMSREEALSFFLWNSALPTAQGGGEPWPRWKSYADRAGQTAEDYQQFLRQHLLWLSPGHGEWAKLPSSVDGGRPLLLAWKFHRNLGVSGS